MSIVAKNEGSDFEPVAAGTYLARCYSMIHVGTKIENIMGVDKLLNKVRLTWELPTELKIFKEENGERPMAISQDFTLSMHEKSNLRKVLESWRGKGFTAEEAEAFDITNLLGAPCQISIIHKISKNQKTYAVISSVTTLMKGTECPDQINPTFEFNYDEPFDTEKFDSLPDWLKDKMRQTDEYKAAHSNGQDLTEETFSTEGDDDLPF